MKGRSSGALEFTRIGADGSLASRTTCHAITDAILRAMGSDPYAYEKQKFAEATREQRAEMADASCKDRLRTSLLSPRTPRGNREGSGARAS